MLHGTEHFLSAAASRRFSDRAMLYTAIYAEGAATRAPRQRLDIEATSHPIEQRALGAYVSTGSAGRIFWEQGVTWQRRRLAAAL